MGFHITSRCAFFVPTVVILSESDTISKSNQKRSM